MARLPEQRNLTLILARSFASQLATAVFLFDAEGTVIYYNEAAERLTGRPFIEGAGTSAEEWMGRGHPLDEEGHEVPIESLPLGMTILKREPAHGVTKFRTADGDYHRFENVTFPLFAHTEDFVGVVAIVWSLEDDRR
ncbi:MAG TPA: PAS domain-containing protein [Actinomycetota bacterium]|nr:PAS domain-containing protein [Actinomycetota bacterium]